MQSRSGNGSPSAELQQYSVHIDGTTYDPVYAGDTLPANVDVSAFDILTGLGTIGVTLSGAGSHTVGLYLDLDAAVNGFVNEFGDALGSPVAGQSWEIDQPGFPTGDIYDNFLAGSLMNAVPGGQPDAVAMALMRHLDLAGSNAMVWFLIIQTPPAGNFALVQVDPASDSRTTRMTMPSW